MCERAGKCVGGRGAGVWRGTGCMDEEKGEWLGEGVEE